MIDVHVGSGLYAQVVVLREIEGRNMRIQDVLRNEREKWAAIWLPISKSSEDLELLWKDAM